MKRFILYFFATIGLITFATLGLLYWKGRALINQMDRPVMVAPNSVLTLHLGEDSLKESSLRNFSLLALGDNTTLKEVLLGLEQAAADERIKGLLLLIEGDQFGHTQVQELRDAFIEFRKTGKFIYVFAETFADGNGTLPYYLATAADKIWLQPSGLLALTGVNLEVPFAKDALDSLSIIPRFVRHGKYKSLPESLLRNDFSEASKANLQSIAQQILLQVKEGITATRNLTDTEADYLINNSPLNAKESLKARLIDAIGYDSDVKKAIVDHLAATPTYIALPSYSKSVTPAPTEATIAVVVVEGLITPTHSREGEIRSAWAATDNTVITSIREAVKDDEVKAIILRINSGGGSDIASETIWHEVQEAIAKGKPVIVSMGEYAASGGYLIAAGASKIVANPLTLTGSIGVFAGKFVLGGLWERLGIHWRTVREGNNAGLWSSTTDFTEEEGKRLQQIVDDAYTMFQAKVATGRKLSPEQVEALAQGRIWTGAEAKANGLVDYLGGFMQAITIAKQEAGLGVKAQVKIKEFPESQGGINKILSLLRSSELKSLQEILLFSQELRLLASNGYPLQASPLYINKRLPPY